MPFTATFFIGVPDNQKAKIRGLTEMGKLIYSLEGNAQFHHYVNIPEENKTVLLVATDDEAPLHFKESDIVVNCITDPDSNGKSLKKMALLEEHIRKHYPNCAVFNAPSKIFATSREKIYQHYHALPGIYLPKTIRITPKSTRDVLRLAEGNNISYPFLIRSCGSHQSQDLQCIESQEYQEKLEYYAYNGSEYYLTEFVDYKSEDRLYRKARLIFIGQEIFPRHYMASTKWEVHSNSKKADMAHYIAEEELFFIRNFHTMLRPETLASFKHIYTCSGLDYLGFDFAIKPDGTALIFEINPAQNPFMLLNSNDPSYLPFVRDNIIAGLNRAVAAKVAEKKMAGNRRAVNAE